MPHAEDRDGRRPRLLRERTYFQVHHASNDREIPDTERLYFVPQGQNDRVGSGRDESLAAAIAMDASVTKEPTFLRLSYGSGRGVRGPGLASVAVRTHPTAAYGIAVC
jgi:hypothetical protein